MHESKKRQSVGTELANADAEQLVRDYAVIEALCHSGLWTIE